MCLIDYSVEISAVGLKQGMWGGFCVVLRVMVLCCGGAMLVNCLVQWSKLIL
jgi:hypothetical protein